MVPNDTNEELKAKIIDLEREVDQLKAEVKKYQAQLKACAKNASDSNTLGVTGEAQAGKEDRFRRIVENSPDIIYRMSLPDGRYEYVSPASVSVFGYTPEAFYENPVLIKKTIHPGWRQYFEEQWKNLLNGHVPETYEYQIIHKNGETRWLNQRNVAVRNAHEELVAIEGIVTDITVRKDIEDELSQIFKMSIDMICIADINRSTFLKVNPAFTEILGYTQEELLEKPFSSFIHPDDVDDTARIIEEKLKAGLKIINFEIRFQCKDGRYKWLSWVSHPVPAKGITYALARDVTSAKNMEAEQAKIRQELLKRNEFIETILENLPIGIGVNYMDTGEVTYLNKKWEEIYGWPREAFPNVTDFFDKVFPDPVARDILKARITNDIMSGDPGRMIWDDLEITTENGEKHTVCGVNIPLPDQNLMISTAQDFTEKRFLQAQVEHAQKIEAIGFLAGGIAHDFNNLLTPIIGLSEILMEDLPQGDPEWINAEEIFNAAKRGRDLVKQILAFSRQAEQNKIPIHVQQVVKEVLKLTRATIPANIRISQDIQTNCPLVLADPTQIHQVVMNLITNAYHAVEQTNGEISVKLKVSTLTEDELLHSQLSPGRYAVLSVSDTGIGFSPEIKDKIFNPYFTTKEKGKGTGLGLSVVYGIVKGHHGDINLYSEKGKGSTFIVYLPIMDQTEKSFSVEEKKSYDTGNETVLLVDDEEAVVRMEKLMLERLGYRVTAHMNSQEAIKAFKAAPHQYDLVISDMSMPEMTGDILAEKLIEIRPDIPIIICTGFSEKIDAEKATALGVKKLLMKPIVKSDMAKIVRTVLDEANQKNTT